MVSYRILYDIVPEKDIGSVDHLLLVKFLIVVLTTIN